MIIEDSSWASYLRYSHEVYNEPIFEIGISMIPQYDVNNPKVSTAGPDVCIIRKENPQEMIASWLFVKFLTTNKDFQSAFSLETGYMPVLKSVAEMPYYAERLAGANGNEGLEMLAMKACFEQQNAYFTLPAFQKSHDVYLEVGAILEAVLDKNSETDVDSLFEKAMDKLKK